MVADRQRSMFPDKLMETLDQLNVRTLNILDESDRLRISLRGGDDGRGPSIVMWDSERKPTFQIHELPDGRFALSFLSWEGDLVRDTSISTNGLFVHDAGGAPAVLIGCLPGSDHYSLTIYKNGELLFELPIETEEDNVDAEERDGEESP